jgi:hypothetical protein
MQTGRTTLRIIAFGRGFYVIPEWYGGMSEVTILRVSPAGPEICGE